MSRSRQNRFEFFSIPEDKTFIGGINTLNLPTDIDDSECVNLVNFELDEADNLVSRGGFDVTSTTPTSRVTSIFYTKLSNGSMKNIFTYGSEINDGVGSIKGAASLPSDTYWQWRTFNDLAIGVNQGVAANMNPVKWTGSGNIAQLTMTGIPAGTEKYKFIEVWNRRLWLVPSSHPNRLHYSALGNPESWGSFIEIDHNDGDIITGIYATRENLFIFKRRKIYRIETGIGGKINTDDTGWSVQKVADNVGCVSGYTIQNILNDLVFLSDEGVQSLRAVQEFGSFNVIPLSRKIKELLQFNKNIDTYSSCVFSFLSQYYLTLTDSPTGVVNNVIYVMDYKRLLQGQPRWFKFKLLNYPASALASSFNITTQEEQILLGSDTPNFDVLRRRSFTKLYNDGNDAIYKEFKSKVFSLGDSFNDKEFHRTGYLISFTQNNCNVTFECRFDEDDNLTRSNSINYANSISGAKWDVENWDNGVFAGTSSNDKIFLQRMTGGNVHRGRTLDFMITNNQVAQDLIIKKLALELELLSLESREQ